MESVPTALFIAGKDMVNRAQRRNEPNVIDAGTGQTVPSGPLQRTPLKSLNDVKRELGRVYRSVKGGQIPSEEGSRRAYILNTLGKVIEAADLERRLDDLERQQLKLIPGSVGQASDGGA